MSNASAEMGINVAAQHCRLRPHTSLQLRGSAAQFKAVDHQCRTAFLEYVFACI